MAMSKRAGCGAAGVTNAVALRKSEKQYRSVVEDQTEVICRVKADGTFTFVNEVYCRLFGKTGRELLGSKWHPAAVPEDLPHIEAQLRMLSPASPVVVVENRVVDGNGSVRWMQFVNRGFFDQQGALAEIQSVGRDITDRKQMEAALRESKERLQLVLDASNDGLWDWDLRSGLAYLSPRYYELTGYQPQDVTPNMAFYTRLIHPDDVSRVVQAMAAHLEGRTEESAVEYRMITQGGAVTWILGRGKVVERASSGAPLRMVGTVSDITERKRLEAERAEAWERLTVIQEEECRRISRELHDQTAQRLVALALELKNLETSLSADSPQVARVGVLRRLADELQRQIRQIAWDLRAGELEEADLESALREYIDDWSGRVQVPAECECRGCCGRRLPAAAETALYRAAQEALANVQRHAQAHRVSVLLEFDEAVARLTVEDDGCGFDADAVFDAPGATQRLGLLGMKERVALVGGTLLIESAPGSGTTLLVRVPIPAEAGRR